MHKIAHSFLIASIIIAGCTSAKRFTNEGDFSPRNSEPKVVETVKKTPEPSTDRNDYFNIGNDALEVLTGVASYYADKFHGRQTANGETFNMYDFTAAHKDYPFNTILRVTNLANNNNILVRINDRGPFIEGRILDLSLGAALKLDMVGDGVADVKIEVLEWGK
ncbi:MAG: septal ring lytic transglycosylase RlpA family protein [Melioribacteraceae bacterium]|nr:septal ring lytic transglycosylase RlpA family protein [Melioribacteraceae bacterium]MCF8263771.1 septal ring lytic transglycosylase RlpA family protein [Melioribacteraceae bacterium]